MTENILTVSSGETLSSTGAKAIKTIVCGGLVVGILDGIAASLNAIFAGRDPAVVWQYVASGLIGKSSYDFGWKSIILGLLIHLFIAFSVTTVYYAASRRFPTLVRRARLFGALYGAAVYFVMALVVTPLSAAPKLPFSFSSTLVGLLIHVVCVGLPIALIVQQSDNWRRLKNL